MHVTAAGWFALAYARHGLGEAGALVTAVGYMFAGKWLLHIFLAGHIVTLGLAWLPLALMWLEQAIQRGSLARATWSALAFALLVLGTHPQWTFYAGLLVIGWTMSVASPLGWRGWLRWAGFGVWAAGLALAIAACNCKLS